MSIASKVIGLLGAVYGLFARTTDANGGTIVRQKGGTPGTHEVQIFHDGTNANVLSKTGQLILATSGGLLNLSNAWNIDPTSTGNLYCTNTNYQITWGGNGTDAGLKRVAAAVLGPTNGAATGGWFQNTAGRAITTGDVTNDSAVLATTGLTRDLKAGRKYSFLAYLYVSTGAILEGIQAGLNGTATITNLLAEVEVKSHATTPVFTMGRLTAFGTAIGQTVADVGNAQVEISGTIEVANAGTFRIDFAKNADTGALLTTVKRGSWLLVEDMP